MDERVSSLLCVRRKREGDVLAKDVGIVTAEMCCALLQRRVQALTQRPRMGKRLSVAPWKPSLPASAE